jgi:drug/metabolite transporter (DMT)-like permease
MYLLMTLLVFLWGYEYIAAKAALEAVAPLSLICIKYSIGLVLLIVVKLALDRRFPLKARDLPLLFICALFGEVMYFSSEYYAMSYLPVSVITIILAFVPCVSILIETVRYKTRPTGLIVMGVLTSVVGVAMVVGADIGELFQGKYIGYLLAFGAVICWNIYNFMTKDLSGKYAPLDLTVLQQVCAIILVLPYTIANFPAPETMTTAVITGILFLGIVSAFIGFLIYVNAIKTIGPTPCALFSNFMPVTTTFFGWLLLSEYISTIQMLGGLVVIASGVVVIREKGKENV